MSIETRARAAADSLSRATERDLEVRHMLDELHHRRGRRTVLYAVAAAAAVALVLGFGALRWSVWHPGASAPAATRPTRTASGTDFPLAVPFTAVPPDGWSHSIESNVMVTIDSPTGPYVEVVMDPTPIPTVASPVPQTLTAASIAVWLAARPELEPTTAVRTTVSGLLAWQVDLKLRPGVSGTQTCDGQNENCLALFHVPGLNGPLGVGTGGEGRAIVVQLPDGRIIGIAEGITGASPLSTILAATQPVVDSISFTSIHP